MRLISDAPLIVSVASALLLTLFLHAPGVAANPYRIKCDLSTLTGKPIMTTTATMMGATASNDASTVSGSSSTYTDGATLTFTLGISQGFIHATSGTIVTAQSSTARTDCVGSNVAAYSSGLGSTFT